MITVEVTPIVATAIPPSAEPTMREALNWALFSATASGTSGLGTSSGTNACWVGLLSALTVPSASASRPTVHSCAALPFSRALRRVRDRPLIQPQAVADMLNDDLGHLLAAREVAQTLKALQRHHQRPDVGRQTVRG